MHKLWDHQRRAIELARPLDHFALLFEPRCGKTRTLIHILEEKIAKENRFLKTLIFTPRIVVETWRQEFKNYSPAVADLVVPLTGPLAKRLKLFKSLQEIPRIFVTNFEAINSKDLFEGLLSWAPEVIVVDESHRIKDHKTLRARKILQLGDKAKFKYILTGTPILNSLEDVYAQYRFLSTKIFGPNFFRDFRYPYFTDKNAYMPRQNYFPNFVPKPGAEEEIKKKIMPVSLAVKREEALDLPDYIQQDVFVEMSPEQKKAYDEMKNEFITFIQMGNLLHPVVAQQAITKVLKLQQIVSGFVTTEKGDEIGFKNNPRYDGLFELLETLAPAFKVIVWCAFKRNYTDVRRACLDLGIEASEIHGGIRNKDAEIKKFNEDPKCRVMIGHPGAGGIGISLAVAAHSIWYSRTFSYEHEVQARARNYESASKVHGKITRTDLVTKGTIDEVIKEAVSRKEALNENITFGNNEWLSLIRAGLGV